MSQDIEKQTIKVFRVLRVASVEKQKPSSTFRRNGRNAELKDGEIHIQQHTPFTTEGGNMFYITECTAQFLQTMDNEQDTWEKHTTAEVTSEIKQEPIEQEGDLKLSKKKDSSVDKKPTKGTTLQNNVKPKNLVESVIQVKERLKKGCGCQMEKNCFLGLDPRSVYKHRLKIAKLTKSEHDMYLMGMTMSCLSDVDTTYRHKERKRLHSHYMYEGSRVCLNAFLYLENCTPYQIKLIRKHVVTVGIVRRVKGNFSKPQKQFHLDIYKHATDFLKHYLEQHTSDIDIHNTKQTVQLPRGVTRENVYDAYKEYGRVNNPGVELMGPTAFNHFMKDQLPHIKFSKENKIPAAPRGSAYSWSRW